MNLLALPRFSPATYADRFADRDCSVVWLETTPEDAASPGFDATRADIMRRAREHRPGCTFAGAFLIVNHGRDLAPKHELVAFTFTGGRPPQTGA